MITQELMNPPSFMAREIIGNDVNLFAARLVCHHVGQKRHEFFARVPWRRRADDFTRRGVQRRVQRQSAVPVVLEPVPFRPAWRQRQYRVQTIQCRLFVDAENGRMLRGILRFTDKDALL